MNRKFKGSFHDSGHVLKGINIRRSLKSGIHYVTVLNIQAMTQVFHQIKLKFENEYRI
jgi:hypothetical protein